MSIEQQIYAIEEEEELEEETELKQIFAFSHVELPPRTYSAVAIKTIHNPLGHHPYTPIVSLIIWQERADGSPYNGWCYSNLGVHLKNDDIIVNKHDIPRCYRICALTLDDNHHPTYCKVYNKQANKVYIYRKFVTNNIPVDWDIIPLCTSDEPLTPHSVVFYKLGETVGHLLDDTEHWHEFDEIIQSPQINLIPRFRHNHSRCVGATIPATYLGTECFKNMFRWYKPVYTIKPNWLDCLSKTDYIDPENNYLRKAVKD